jgi:hypothetical protein
VGRPWGGRFTEGGSDDGGLEELVELVLSRRSNSAIRRSKASNRARTASWASGGTDCHSGSGIGGGSLMSPGIGNAPASGNPRPLNAYVLTGQDLEDADLFSISLSEDPRRQVLQRRIYGRQARRWQAWWEENWRTITDDAASRAVGLIVADEPLPPAPQALGNAARLGDGVIGAVLSPAIDEGQHAWLCYDLDTGYRPHWPPHIPRDEAARDPGQLADWASRTGVDLVCTTHRSPDGAETYVLRALGMDVREIGPRDVRNLDRLIAAGTLPEGRPVDELLMQYDAGSQRLVPDANAAFLFVTREGNMGLIETTDRVTRTANLTGLAGSPPPGVGFRKGVRFNLKAIIP